MGKITLYIKDALNELINKTTWPTWKELQNSSIVVLIASFIIAILIFLMDISFENIMKLIYSMFY